VIPTIRGQVISRNMACERYLRSLKELTASEAAFGQAGRATLLTLVDVRQGEPAGVILAGCRMIVTPDGTWVREGSREFFVALGDTDPDYDASLFAVKNLGFIVVGILGKSLINIKLHPRNVAPAALHSVKQWLASIQYETFQISYLKEDWVLETLSSTARTIYRLSEICNLHGAVGLSTNRRSPRRTFGPPRRSPRRSACA
jgi:hypothetical protein